MQIDLFGKSIEKPKILPSLPYGQNGLTFEEFEHKIASEYGRKHIGFPCDKAQDMPIDDRPEHIKNCEECKKLIKKYDDIASGKKTSDYTDDELLLMGCD